MNIIKKGEVTYWCKTKELAEQFFKDCEQQGITWNNGQKPTEFPTKWSKHKRKTAYEIFHGCLFYSDIDYALRNSNRIIEYEAEPNQIETALRTKITDLTRENIELKSKMPIIERALKNTLQDFYTVCSMLIDCGEEDILFNKFDPDQRRSIEYRLKQAEQEIKEEHRKQ